MAYIDPSKKPFIQDRDENVFIGIDLPFHKSNGVEGWFKSTETTIEAVKNNIRLLLQTEPGERLFQPTLGINLRRMMFEPITADLQSEIETEIVDAFNFWLPFVDIQDLDVQVDVPGDRQEPGGRNTVSIKVTFNIKKDPNTLDSVAVDIGE